MTVEEKIDELWGVAYSRDYWNTQSYMDDIQFETACEKLAQWQRERCEQEYVKFSAEYFGQLEHHIRKEYREEINAILHAGETDD